MIRNHLDYRQPETVEPADCTQRPSAQRVSCGKCGKTFGGGAVISDTPQTAWEYGEPGWMKKRSLPCDHCSHVMSWFESCTVDGTPTGFVYSGPGYSKDVDRFLKKHPEAAGVSQS